MHRPFAVLIAVALVALSLLLASVPLAAPPAPPSPAPDLGSVIAVGEVLVAAHAAESVEVAPAREAVDPLVSDPSGAGGVLTFVMTGAPTEELHGIAFVRRKDGSTTEVPFEGGLFSVEDRSTLDGVSLRVPGFAIAWPRLEGVEGTVEVTMQRAGVIRVRLTDAEGRPLAHRAVGALFQGPSQKGTSYIAPLGVGYQANARGVTGVDGVAEIEHVLPGTHDVFAARVAEWQPVQQRRVAVRAGEVTTCELVSATLPPSRYGAFCFARSAAPRLSGFENDVHSHIFATADGRQYMLSFLGDEVRCAVQGSPGDLVTGSIVPIDASGAGRELPPISAPITVTVGAVVDWRPIWVR